MHSHNPEIPVVELENVAEEADFSSVIFLLLYCRVLVLDAGRIIEYDTPQNLLQQKGAFSEMVAEAGIRR